ncbi:MAG: trypsin-like peptidase domain-containing protein [Clostridia bacterium]|nr:trypsin-like peptidase domain-containing protein [Clostridia bacterium]
MSDEYQNGLSSTPDNEKNEPLVNDDFATTAEEPVAEIPVTEEIPSAPVQEEAPSPERMEERVDYVQPPVQPRNTSGNSYYVNNQVPPYSQPYNNNQPYPNTQPYYGYNQYNAPQSPAPQPQKKKKGLLIFLIILAFVIFVGIVFGAVSFVVRRTVEPNTSVSDQTNVIVENENDENAPVMQIEPSPSDGKAMSPAQIAEKVKPSVVAIIVYSNRTGGVVSEGSGVLWKEDDSGKYTYIITCAHVIAGSGQTYTVQTEDGTQYDAEMIGADAKTDLGVIRIEKTGLALAEFGDSSALRVGDPVYAIGNPGGTEFFGSFTDGVVSAIDRSVQSTYTMICIQHTAAINPGNSGGALVNAYGQVIGINSLKIIDTEYEGMGFAVPIKSAQPIINSLAAYGYVPNRPKLGISYTEAINYQQYSMIIKIKGLPSGSLIITEINADSALANTDAKQYDMIIGVNGQEMTSPNVLLDIIEKGAVGDELTLTICRIDNNYQTTEFDVKVKLVEEKKVVEEETTVSSQPIDPFDYFNGFLW